MAKCLICEKTIPGLGGNDYTIKDGLMCKECMTKLLNVPSSVLYSKTKEIEEYKKLDSTEIKQIFADRQAKKDEEAAKIEAEKQKMLEEVLAKKIELAQKRAENDRIALILNDIYEYDVVNVFDNSSGDVNVYSISKTLEEHAEKGWRLVSTFTNEIGHTSSYSSISGMGSGTNATIDQVILVFERRIAKAKEEE